MRCSAIRCLGDICFHPLPIGSEISIPCSGESSLLCAAAAKLYGFIVSPFAQYGKLLNTSVQFAAVKWEIVLGVWLLSGRRPLGAWLAAVLTFAAFAVVSGYLGLIGQASCGCFGAIQASPWVAFAFDVVALILLGIARPDFKALSAPNGDGRSSLMSASLPSGWRSAPG